MLKESKIFRPDKGLVFSEEVFRKEFEKRVEELKKWGSDNGYEINAYLHISITGIQADIGYIKKK